MVADKIAANFMSFNTQPPEGGWSAFSCRRGDNLLFQHTAARRRLDMVYDSTRLGDKVSTHSRPKAAGHTAVFCQAVLVVSTHSRPKAAGYCSIGKIRYGLRFNTQPPEGGWQDVALNVSIPCGFNTQPPEGGWVASSLPIRRISVVSTHSRPKAAGRAPGV